MPGVLPPVLGAALLGLATTVGLHTVGRNQGLTERLGRLEAHQANPLGLVEMAAELEALEERLATAERSREAEAERRAELVRALAGVRDRLGRTVDRLDALRTGRSATEARLASLELGAADRLDGLTRAVEAAHGLASETRDELERLIARGDHPNRWTTMLAPSVQLSGKETVGSGVVLSSYEPGAGRGHETLLLTAWHVVRDIQEELPGRSPPVPVTLYDQDGRRRRETARPLVHDAGLDLAVLRLNTDEPVPHGAILPTREELRELDVFDPVVAVGCPLGNDPIPTGGQIAETDHRIDGESYWMISAPTYIGNSGGGIFDARSSRLIGIFSKIYTYGHLRPAVIPHMGLAAPLDRVYDWLEACEGIEVVETADGVRVRAGRRDRLAGGGAPEPE